jgi:anaerobic magnesium-protoporphyrin IX monomethyl ester cyclase
MSLDGIIISDYGADTFSGVSSLRLEIEGRVALIQVVSNLIKNQGGIDLVSKRDNTRSWSSAPKLNGIYLHNYLTINKFDVEIINNYFEEKDKFKRLLKQSPRVVIISTTFIHSKQILRKLVDDIRSLSPDIYIIVGGTFIYLSYLMLQRSHEQNFDTESAKDDYLFLENNDEPSVDLYIINLHGEETLCESLRRVKQDRSTDDLPNTAHLEMENYIINKQINENPMAEDIAIDWDLLPEAVFKSGVFPLQASNGCPYKCAFCNFTKDRQIFFIKTIDQTIDELKTLSKRGVRYVRFVDDNFRLGRNDLNQFCKKLIKEDLQIRWMSFIRASSLKKVNIDLLRRSGCIEVQLGLESADPQILRNMNKKATPELYAEVVGKSLAAGINCSCCFLFGFPGETEESSLRTREFIKSIEHPQYDGILTWSIFPFILAPLAPIYENESRKKYGLTGYMENWKHNTMDSNKAREEVKKAFFELDNSGPIYNGDNLDMLFDLVPSKRKKFVTIRHRLSKSATKYPLKKQDIIQAFSEVFTK